MSYDPTEDSVLAPKVSFIKSDVHPRLTAVRMYWCSCRDLKNTCHYFSLPLACGKNQINSVSLRGVSSQSRVSLCEPGAWHLTGSLMKLIYWIFFSD